MRFMERIVDILKRVLMRLEKKVKSKINFNHQCKLEPSPSLTYDDWVKMMTKHGVDVPDAEASVTSIRDMGFNDLADHIEQTRK